MSDVKKLLKTHGQLNQLDNVKVESHVQRDKDDWVINMSVARVFILTSMAMLAFAGNSILCRVALKQTAILGGIALVIVKK